MKKNEAIELINKTKSWNRKRLNELASLVFDGRDVSFFSIRAYSEYKIASFTIDGVPVEIVKSTYEKLAEALFNYAYGEGKVLVNVPEEATDRNKWRIKLGAMSEDEFFEYVRILCDLYNEDHTAEMSVLGYDNGYTLLIGEVEFLVTFSRYDIMRFIKDAVTLNAVVLGS
jgi:hypothetical protein